MKEAPDLGLEVGRTFETDWSHIEEAELRQFWKASRLDQAYGDFNDEYVPGFYLLALFDPLANQIFSHSPELEDAVNYGFDRIRFTAFVVPGDDVRLSCKVAAVDRQPIGTKVSLDCELQLKTGKPAVAARWIYLVPTENPREGK